VNTGSTFVILKDADERERTQQQIADQLSGRWSGIHRCRDFRDARNCPSGREAPVCLCDLCSRRRISRSSVKPSRSSLAETRKHPAFQFVDVNLKFNKPELRVEINRDRAPRLGVSALDIAHRPYSLPIVANGLTTSS